MIMVGIGRGRVVVDMVGCWMMEVGSVVVSVVAWRKVNWVFPHMLVLWRRRKLILF